MPKAAGPLLTYREKVCASSSILTQTHVCQNVVKKYKTTNVTDTGKGSRQHAESLFSLEELIAPRPSWPPAALGMGAHVGSGRVSAARTELPVKDALHVQMS